MKEGGLLKWSATPTFSFQRLTAQAKLPKLYYSYVEWKDGRDRTQNLSITRRVGRATELTGAFLNIT